MKTINICGMPYRVHSPSLFESTEEPIAIGYNGYGWVIAVHNKWGKREFTTRNDAGQFILDKFLNSWNVVNQC